jgi:hypothetical protein
MATAVRICRVLLLAVLIVWAAAAPLAWILRDGLGPDAVDSRGAQAAGKFLAGWGVPALVIALLVAGSWLTERRLGRAAE